jgi:hypothetical protein
MSLVAIILFRRRWLPWRTVDRCQSDGGIEVSMVAFQAVDPGSIPGHRSVEFWLSVIKLRNRRNIPSFCKLHYYKYAQVAIRAQRSGFYMAPGSFFSLVIIR